MPTPQSCVAVVGSSNTDLILSGKKLPLPGETLLGGKFQQKPGGKGANQAVAAARAGAHVFFIGARGDDDFGKRAFNSLSREGIDLRHFSVKKKTSSGIALILLGGKTRENMIGVAESANDFLNLRDLGKARAELLRAGVIVCQLETPLEVVTEAARFAARNKIPFLLNPAPARPLPSSLLDKVHTLTPNEHEAFILTGEKDPAKAGAKLLKRGCRQIVITLGAKGALLVNGEGRRHFPAPKVKPLDTVGAGDCFSGWLAVGLAEEMPMEENIKRALEAASLSVTREGAQEGMPWRREFT